MSDKQEYQSPKLTVDVIIQLQEGSDDGQSIQLMPDFSDSAEDPTIVLIERENEPLGYALPGGFVDYGEPGWQAAIREAKEETNIDVELVELLGVYSNPKRDARVHAVSLVYVAKGYSVPLAGDDAKEVEMISLSDARQMRLVFDHGLILSDFATYLKHGVRPDWYR